jgi:hypothetical protein
VRRREQVDGGGAERRQLVTRAPGEARGGSGAGVVCVWLFLGAGGGVGSRDSGGVTAELGENGLVAADVPTAGARRGRRRQCGASRGAR